MSAAIHDGTSRDPASRDTAIAMSGGERFRSTKRILVWQSDVCPPLRRLPPTGPDVLNLVGVKFGRFTVMGLPVEKVLLSRKTAAWVVRCSCGKYEHRSAKSIRNPNNFGDRCHCCRELAEKKRLREWHSYGREVDWRTL